MKKVLLIVGLTLLLTLICTIMLYSQVSSWRSNPPTPQRSTPSIQPSIPQRNDVSRWRNESPRESNRPQQNRRGSNIIVRDPFFNDWGWGWNRWNMWGAPSFGWNHWNQGFYFNDWGYRQPARVYMYDNGKRDTIKGKKPVISFGVQKTTDNQVGGFFTIGNKGYFITEYNFTHDRSTFYRYGRLGSIDFPLVDDLVKLNSFYVGFGKRIKRTGVHFMVGSVNEIVRYRGKDDDGYITFPKYSNRFTTIKIGTLHDYKNFTLKVDYDPLIRNGTFGLGINF
jgi:hypothetical protein